MQSSENIESATDSPGSVAVEPGNSQQGCEHADTAKEVVGEGSQEGALYYLVRCAVCGAEQVKEGTP